MSGGLAGARDGMLTCMNGGETTALEAAGPVLRAVGRSLTHQGPPGARQVCKSAIQLIITAPVQAVTAALDHGVFAPAKALSAQMSAALANSGRGGLDAYPLGALVAELSALPTGPEERQGKKEQDDGQERR